MTDVVCGQTDLPYLSVIYGPLNPIGAMMQNVGIR